MIYFKKLKFLVGCNFLACQRSLIFSLPSYTTLPIKNKGTNRFRLCQLQMLPPPPPKQALFIYCSPLWLIATTECDEQTEHALYFIKNLRCFIILVTCSMKLEKNVLTVLIGYFRAESLVSIDVLCNYETVSNLCSSTDLKDIFPRFC